MMWSRENRLEQVFAVEWGRWRCWLANLALLDVAGCRRRSLLL
jgi:hypothetical protein